MTRLSRRAPARVACVIAVLAACSDPAGPPLGSLILTVVPQAVHLVAGGDTNLLAVIRDTSGALVQYAVDWTSSDTTVATVDALGTVTGRAAGFATIGAATHDVRDSARVLVTGPISGIAITPAGAWAHPGTTVQLMAELTDSGGGIFIWDALPWVSGNTGIATVTATGAVHGIALGNTTVTLSLGGHADTVPVRVVPPVASVVVAPVSITAVPGAAISFLATALDANGAPIVNYPIAWSSEDTTIAWVLPTGLVGVNATGSVAITASAAPASKSAPVTVRTVLFTQVEAGDFDQICGVSTDSLGFCWGQDAEQFGTGTVGGLGTVTAPVQVTDSIRFTELHGGEGYTCGLAVGGAAYCWGYNANGRLGNGASGPSFPGPGAVIGGHSFVTMGVGHSIACGIESDAEMYCWGGNQFGELGSGATPPGFSGTPVIVTGGLSWRSVAPGTLTTCGIASDSAAYCWGSNWYGKLGIGDTLDRNVPTAVSGGLKFTSISSASLHTCGVTDSGAAYCWGKNATGALGDSTRQDSSLPVLVRGGLTFRQISAGGLHYGRDFTCGVTTTDVAYCWGEGQDGALGNNDVVSHDTPVPVSGGLAFATVTAGFTNACGLTTTGVTYCWGRYFGTTPVRVAGQP